MKRGPTITAGIKTENHEDGRQTLMVGSSSQEKIRTKIKTTLPLCS